MKLTDLFLNCLTTLILFPVFLLLSLVMLLLHPLLPRLSTPPKAETDIPRPFERKKLETSL